MKKYNLFFCLFVLSLLVQGTSLRAQFSVSGLILSGGQPLANSRVTLFDEDEVLFREVRSSSDGVYKFSDVPTGTYTIGATAPGKEYLTVTESLATSLSSIDFRLENETHPGNWEVIMQSPEPLGGTDLGILQPDGKIFYCHNSKDPFLFDPVLNDTALVAGDDKVQGCVGPALLPSGEIIFLGGADREVYGPGTKLVKTYDPVTEFWTEKPDMLDYRWYPTMVQLADGKLLLTGGGGLDNPVRVRTSEVYDPENLTSEAVDDIAIGNEVSPIVLLYDGRALMTHRPPQLFTPTNGQWELAADFAQANRMPNGDHSDHELVLLPEGKTVAIGYKSFDENNLGSFVETYDPSANQWRVGESLSPIRSRAKALLLPDKKILVIGGEKEDLADPAPVNAWGSLSLTDSYDPYTNTWRRLMDIHVAREYHCTTILVPDGRVIAVGGEGAPGREPEESTIEAFSPPYLFKGIRPEIHDLNRNEFSRGEDIVFSIEKTAAPTSVILMSLQAVTHFMNTGNNRYLELDFDQQANVVSATVPIDSLAALPGYYMLFVMVDDIPSVAEIVKISNGQIISSTENSTDAEINLSIFPNPTSSHVFVRGDDIQGLELYTVDGKFLSRISSKDKLIGISLKSYPVGTYLLKVNTSTKTILRKVLKQ